MGAPLNHNQLKLFMTGTEWQGAVNDSTDLGGWSNDAEGMSRLWSSKEEEARQPAEHKVYDVQWRGGRGQRVTIASSPNYAHGAGLYDSIKRDGYVPEKADEHDMPATLAFTKGGTLAQWEGHHRIAAAAAVERDTGRPAYIPTNYTEF